MSAIWESLRSTYFSTPTISAAVAYLLYYAYICTASILLPAKSVKGHPQPKRGPQLTYSINGFRLTLLTLALVLAFGGVLPRLKSVQLFRVAALAQQFWPLWSVVNIVALSVSAFLYLKGRCNWQIGSELVDLHSHGSFGLDFWVGRELNPRIGTFDIKFVAYRVAMIFWLVLNLSFAALQTETMGSLSLRMISYQLLTGLYILDYFWNEEKMLTTWDIISEQFGYMLVFGDYVFIPFAFSVQCHYLVEIDDYSHWAWTLSALLLFFIGYYLFRTSNSQKNQFKTNPNQQIWGEKPKTIEGKLLISGFWGLGRHMNYTGDLIMAVAYCLPCGWQVGGYFYFFYLLTLLTHRAFRDDAKCQQKYKHLWKQYSKAVPQVFLPLEPLDLPLRGMGKVLYRLTNGANSNEATSDKRN